MAGKVVVSTLNNDTGVLATQNGMTGIAKAWVRWTGSTGAIVGSFNVSSVTRSGTGDFTVNYTTAMPNTTYAFAVGTADYTTAGPSDPTTEMLTTSIRILTRAPNNAATVDRTINSVVIFSS